MVAVVVVAGGGYFLLGNKSSANNSSGGGGGNNGGGGGAPTVAAAPAKLPGCVQKPVNGKPADIINATTQLSNADPSAPSHPFAVATTPNGKYTFVTLGGGLAVLKNGDALMPKVVHTINMPGANKGFQFSKDGKQLIVATNGGAYVYSEAAAEQGQAQLLGKLESPGGNGAVQTAMSQDGKFLFVTLQSSTGVAVFNYAQAAASGFQQNGLVGVIPTGLQPVGIDLSPDGQTMYVTSMQKKRAEDCAGRRDRLRQRHQRAEGREQPEARGPADGHRRVRPGPGDHHSGRQDGLGHRPGERRAARLRHRENAQ